MTKPTRISRRVRYYLKIITPDGLVKDATDRWGDWLTPCGVDTEEECWEILERQLEIRGWSVDAFVVREFQVEEDEG